MIIGLIGGIGSGKSTVTDYLAKNYNAYVIDSDSVAKELMLPGTKAFEEIKVTFPEVMVDDEIDKNLLTSLVMSDEDKLKKLNSITHPAAIKKVSQMLDENDSDIKVIESALLIGTGLEDKCDEIWFVYCAPEKRIKRLMEFRDYSREKADAFISNQPSDEYYNSHCDSFIDNSGTIDDTKEQIDILLSMMPCSF